MNLGKILNVRFFKILRGTKGKERISKKEGEGTQQIGGGTTRKRGRRWPVRWIRLCFKPIGRSPCNISH